MQLLKSSTLLSFLCCILAARPGAAAKFRYRDNMVEFSIMTVTEDVTLNNFEIIDYECTRDPNQDPLGKTFRGQIVPFKPTNFASASTLTFTVGRHHSRPVADYWNRRVNSSETTFDQPAGELNFAILGTIHGTFIDGNDSRPFTVPDIALAQGHSGLSNNWWVGAIGGHRVHGDAVQAAAAGVDMCFVFGRGGYVDGYPEEPPKTVKRLGNTNSVRIWIRMGCGREVS